MYQVNISYAIISSSDAGLSVSCIWIIIPKIPLTRNLPFFKKYVIIHLVYYKVSSIFADIERNGYCAKSRALAG